MDRTVEEITQIIMLQHVLQRVNALEVALLPISEAIASMCGSTDAIARGIKVLADEQTRTCYKASPPHGAKDDIAKWGVL
jgi:hypothetical protein